MLSVHGKREDGFHELTSVVAPVEFGDTLYMRPIKAPGSFLVCDHEEVPTDESNLVLQAARLFREATGQSKSFEFRLEKRVPVGAGLGGGSSDGTSALVALNEYFGGPLGSEELRCLASDLGSDCALFVDPKPAIMRGRGEMIEPLPADAAKAISGQRVVLLRPPFGVNTGWAYQTLASTGEAYEDQESAGRRLNGFLETRDLGGLLYNSFEVPVGEKYLAIPSILGVLRGSGLDGIMSGSGSSCFALLDGEANLSLLAEECQKALGSGIFFVETLLL